MKFRRQPLGLIRPKTKTKPSSEQPVACNQTHYFHECVDSCYYPLARNTVFAQTYFPGGDKLDSNCSALECGAIGRVGPVQGALSQGRFDGLGNCRTGKHDALAGASLRVIP